MKITLKTLDIVGIVLVLGFVIFIFNQNVKANRLLSNQKKIIDLHLIEFQQDQQFADQLDFFKPTSRKKNAGEFLNSRIRWKNSNQNSFQNVIHLNDIDWYGESAQEFADLSNKLKHNPVNTEWMKEMLAYDHWDLYSKSPQEDSYSVNVNRGPWEMPYPSMSSLSADWATVRLLQGLNENNVDQAIREVQHFAKILYTTEVPIYILGSVAYLNRVAIFVEKLKIKSKIKIFNVQEVSRLKRLAKARHSITVYPWDKTELEKIQGVFGFCSSLADRMTLALYFRPILSGQLSDYRDITTQMIREHDECNLTLLKKIWSDSAFEKFYDQKECNNVFNVHACSSMNQISKIPFFGPISAKINIAAVAEIYDWEGYENQEN